jgi:hypothetical protein
MAAWQHCNPAQRKTTPVDAVYNPLSTPLKVNPHAAISGHLPCSRPAEQPVHPSSVTDTPAFFSLDMYIPATVPVIPAVLAPSSHITASASCPSNQGLHPRARKCTSLRQTPEAWLYYYYYLLKACDFIRKRKRYNGTKLILVGWRHRGQDPRITER